MVTIKTRLGIFSIVSGEITVGDSLLRTLYGYVIREGVGPSDGPLDFAIGMKMVKYIGGKYIIQDSLVPELDKNVVY